jgi:hypothetical protein
MNQRTMYALLILAAAGAGYWYYKNRQTSNASQTAMQDQGPAQAAQQNYTVPPDIGVQQQAGGQVYLNNGQTQPMPYNG